MSTDLTFHQHIEIVFQPLNKKKASLPAQGALATALRSLVDKAAQAGTDTIATSPQVTSWFGTAAVEMWTRGVHSFLISAALTQVSPIWASTSGYYASHYVMRGFAHLLGFFQLYRQKKCIVQIKISDGKHLCQITKKNAGDREHKFYWKTVKQHPSFENDPFFTNNVEDNDESDAAHRNIASYSDHIGKFPSFRPLDEKHLKERLEKLAGIELSSVPIPNRERYPDVEAVQLVAYHRIVKFRGILDEVLGGKNRFWNVHRNPAWCADFVNFQVVEPTFISSYGAQR